MEKARERGYTRSIGVSNFSVEELEQVIAAGGVRAESANQVQFSPFEYRRALLEACERSASCSRPTARWAPAATWATRPSRGSPSRLERTPAQVLLRWCVQREIPVIPKSTHRERIEENAQIFDFALTDEDMAALDALDHTDGTDRARERKWW